MKLTTALTFVAAALAVTTANAMPRDQIEAGSSAVAIAAPPASPQAELSYDQYMAMSVEERIAIIALLQEVAAANGDLSSLDLLADPNNLTGPWAWIKCKVCTKSIGYVIGKVQKYGCGKFSLYAASICEIAGLGPEDPLANTCAAALIAACPIVAKAIAHKITNPTTVCKKIKFCS